jgi:hypothetical protein
VPRIKEAGQAIDCWQSAITAIGNGAAFRWEKPPPVSASGILGPRRASLQRYGLKQAERLLNMV